MLCSVAEFDLCRFTQAESAVAAESEKSLAGAVQSESPQ